MPGYFDYSGCLSGLAHSRLQRVNQAYDANDLLTLLGLQLEIEQIDAAHLSSVPPQRLAHYNQILREQLADLESELEYCIQPFRHSMGGRWGALTPATVDQHLNIDIAQLRATNRELQKVLVAFRDPNNLGAMLKHYKLEQYDDSDDLTELMDFFQAPAPTRRGKTRRS